MTKDRAEVKAADARKLHRGEYKRENNIYKSFNIEKAMEKALQLVWGNVNFLTRGRRHGTIEVKMTTKEKTQLP